MTNSRKAIFLDRDGVINKEHKDYVKNIDELEVFSDIVNPLKLLQQNEFLLIVITNQSAINRGLTTVTSVNEIHNKIQNFLNGFSLFIDEFYICPHRPDENCDCRKPKPGLILRATKEHSIDLSKSWMIGDNQSDITAASLSGCKGLLIDEKFRLDDAVQYILEKS